MRLSLSIIISAFTLAGCATNATTPPSQNSSLNAVSPNTAAVSQGGAMQSSLDSWLKEDWVPNSASGASTASSSTSKGTSAATSASIEPTVVSDEKPFTLQSYADKWKAYHENKEKMNEGKPKEASHIDAVNALPVIGK
ncbi:MAG TPA: hypothetical protein PLM93_05160 [Sulfuricurvum sp.]|nr:MAG: hypothetical protein B7Y30_03660 [Campylobacterales bacterium 16-40-21]OZA03374.1 MAG: hypothetical protein B7X89_05115 [Sulfuricurvum sp. 17-40-25]HQS66562.1 hypothetical protein [Sulfuricurvum sp.]HQT35405.1 hypothetical protein [Sulfuricurvum sp.]